MKVLALSLLLLTQGFAAEPPTDFIQSAEADSHSKLDGMWYKDCGKGQQATKWFSNGHMSVTVYDTSSGSVVSHHEGTWIMDKGESVERVLVTTKNWNQIRNKVFRSKITFPTPSTLKQEFTDGNVEIWRRVP